PIRTFNAISKTLAALRKTWFVVLANTPRALFESRLSSTIHQRNACVSARTFIYRTDPARLWEAQRNRRRSRSSLLRCREFSWPSAGARSERQAFHSAQERLPRHARLVQPTSTNTTWLDAYSPA